MQPGSQFPLRMKVTAVLIALVVTLIGMYTYSANSESIALDSFAIGNRAKVVYTAPPTGRVTTNLYDEDDDIPIRVDYRVNWDGEINSILLNSRTGGTWGTDVHIRAITTIPGTHVTLLIITGQNASTITFNGKQVATYNYSFNKPVTKIECEKHTHNSVVEELAVLC